MEFIINIHLLYKPLEIISVQQQWGNVVSCTHLHQGILWKGNQERGFSGSPTTGRPPNWKPSEWMRERMYSDQGTRKSWGGSIGATRGNKDRQRHLQEEVGPNPHAWGAERPRHNFLPAEQWWEEPWVSTQRVGEWTDAAFQLYSQVAVSEFRVGNLQQFWFYLHFLSQPTESKGLLTVCGTSPTPHPQTLPSLSYCISFNFICKQRMYKAVSSIAHIAKSNRSGHPTDEMK